MIESILLIALFVGIYVLTAVLMILYPRLGRKSLSFGISIPSQQWSSPEVSAIRRQYERAGMLLSVILAVPAFLPLLAWELDSPWPALANTGALMTMLAGFGLLYLVCHRRMRLLKAGTDWDRTADNLVSIQTDFQRGKTTPSPLWFIPMGLSVVASLLLIALFYGQAPDPVPTHFNGKGVADAWSPKSPGTFLTGPVMQLFLLVVFAFAWISIRRSKQQIDPTHPEASAEQNRRFRYAWSAFVLASGNAMCWMFAMIPLSMLALMPPSWFLIVTVAVSFAVISASVLLSIRYGQGGSRLSPLPAREAGRVINRNDDRHWKLGVFYVNPEDPALFLEKRFGIGWTMNFGRPMAWVVVGALVLLIVGSFFLPAMMQ